MSFFERRYNVNITSIMLSIFASDEIRGAIFSRVLVFTLMLAINVHSFLQRKRLLYA